MGSLAYVEVDRNDVDNDEDSRIIVIRDEERVGDEDDEVSPRDSRSGRLSGTPAVALSRGVRGRLLACVFAAEHFLLRTSCSVWRSGSNARGERDGDG